MKPRKGARPAPAQTMIIGVKLGSTGGLKRDWPGRTEQLSVSPAFRLARKCDANPGVAAWPGITFGAACLIRDQVMVSDVDEARGDDEIEYWRGRIGVSMVASCCSEMAMLEYVLSSRRIDGRRSVDAIPFSITSKASRSSGCPQ